jgi:voltage-gated potassium channel
MFALIVLVEFASIYVLKAEAGNPNANLTSAEDAVWWVFVTVTTVVYGDRFPVTSLGRIIGVMVMFGGIALIGVLASFLSNFFLAPPQPKERELDAGDPKFQILQLQKMLEEQEKTNTALREKLGDLANRL